MKTLTSHRRSLRQTSGHPRSLTHLRTLSHARAAHAGPAATRNRVGGDGHLGAGRSRLAIRPELTAWLGKPKHNLIGGKWVAAASGRLFDVFNPADASVIARVPDSEREDINRAVTAARHAFDAGPWGHMTPSERGRLIWRIGDLILDHADEFADLESLDNGKPRAV